MEQYIGIDNSSSDHKIKAINNSGELLFSMNICNGLSGFEKLNSKLKECSNPRIGFESAHGPLIDFLKINKHSIFSLNPLKIKRFKETIIISGNKTDDIDAFAIAEYLRSNQKKIKEMKFNSSEIEKLKVISIIHTRLTNDKSRHLNKLRFTIRQYFPLHDSLFSSFGCLIQLKMILKYPTYEELKEIREEKLKEFFIENSYRQRSNIEKILKKIKKYEQIISPDVEFGYKIEAKCLCEIILILNQELKNIEEKMTEITNNHEMGKSFQSLPGAGTVLSAKLLALFGDNQNRFNTASDIQCLFGTAPKNYQSGNYHKVLMRKACNKNARSVLYKFAFCSLRFSKWAREYYDNQRGRGKTNSVAVRALSNKWIKVIFAIWKNNLVYDENIKNCLT